ncbi:NAD(P)-dependent oxidoreductase [Pectobacterium parvum]|uniref:NAD-dependent epimerase/dehydratase family protein n=1 Tax=Pectobacterium parvum TaxID=2778550 RepID=A0AAP9IEI5_9GAMM|nr:MULTISPECIES: NAD(P)-dependent oxidoreductase [Pectobacterium]GKW40883.1 UDP-glucose 4-epimerase [Pectobacterium carotovorum subsp. carotovorum]KFX10613.1 hypothetical protein KP17_18170 [Pectobacterium parvum]QHQ23227.1 NAD-dependent epimerase/dehydratase family protein [Pectobacterium parvum]UFK38889.1 NAD(P)-dependent oxidoreductase [Pectobacterium parvum]UVD97010.1 NAD(P)-dependent oxidoreductase [Pectobacterium parvum]
MENFGKVLITGGLGFIGRKLISSIHNRSEWITVVDIASEHSDAAVYEKINELKNITFLKKDCSLSETYEALDMDYDYIFHMGAILGIKLVADEPIQTMDVNILGLRKCLDFAIKQVSLKKFIFFSTSEVYGPEATKPDEGNSFIINNDSMRWCYAASKMMGEFYCKAYSQKHSLPYVIIRPFNVYGPNRYGTNAMTALVTNAVNNKDIKISGNGEQRRSWCHINDFVSTVISASILPFDEHNCIFNVGNSDCYLSMKDLASLVVLLAESKSRIMIAGDATPDVVDRRPNTLRAEDLLNHMPKVSLEDGIKDVIAWVENVDGKRRCQ